MSRKKGKISGEMSRGLLGEFSVGVNFSRGKISKGRRSLRENVWGWCQDHHAGMSRL